MRATNKDAVKKTIILPAEKPGKKNREYEVALLLDFVSETKLPFRVATLLVQELNGDRNYKLLPLNNERSLHAYKKFPHEILYAVRLLTAEQLDMVKGKAALQYKLMPAGDISRATFIEQKMLSHIYYRLQELKPFSAILKWYYRYADDLNNIFIKPAAFSSYTPKLCFELVRTPKGLLRMLVMVNINDQHFPLTDFKRHGFLLQSKNEFFLLPLKDMEALHTYPQGFADVPAADETDFVLNTVEPLAKTHTVNRDVLLQDIAADTPFQASVYLGELNNSFLMITPKWQYGDFEMDDEPGDMFTAVADRKRYAIKRDAAAENDIKQFLCGMHENFPKQKNGYYYLPFAEAEKKQWFVKFYRRLLDKNIPVYGMEQLKHFRYNRYMPVIHIHFDGKGIDWFDLRVEISYGDQEVPLSDLQKAFHNKQSFLLLKDGTIGAIPEEWAQAYGMLFRMGQVKKSSIRLSALHHTLLDNLKDGEAISAEAVTKEFKEKWRRLQQHKEHLYTVPKEIKASLRDYQQAGFEWLCLLDEMHWGGCLADDMGLGKTLQAITFLQHVCNQKKQETHLVVCPTSLLYNWENELKKFAPQLTCFIYYKGSRNYDADTFKQYNIVLTTYGCIRSDIEQLEQFSFGYIVCDESHIIKNPAAQLSRAVMRLQARNRIALSGTPVQNNTFDLYTQMNFINPGLLGNREFFKSEFSQPIDKYGDKEKSAQLKKIIYPFLLRRTKEQVAKDLPAKTEITLWCEMGEEQRKIYDVLKHYYRESLLQRIAEDGIGHSAMYILEGLTKLRQACNAPQLLKDYKDATNTSVKLEVLLNELEENTGDHKVLVFSQFTGMLQLMADALKKDAVSFLYLDGSTKAAQRQELVQQFQTANDTKIFLISLKAGGVGLTLTAADYVYLVDPWWNPAAEQQAIDRTHRIGQQQKVFAYKMICRDTVEEKILALQQKKQLLVKDIISEDAGFIKSLGEDDVKYLFA
ncbi:DEAD/DEAH box helicase [Parafilimonas sp.]|uniref:DEAD/DEAH box helicase n=1 Tax=Parafilimonas sp. TaxID=1969739 RepID=UPI0039E48C81